MQSRFDKASTLRLSLATNAAGNIITNSSSATPMDSITVSMDMINLEGFTPENLGGVQSNTANASFNLAVDTFATDILALLNITYDSSMYKDISTTIDWRTS